MHQVFNPVAPYGYLLPTVYLFMADIVNLDLFVCGCRTCVCLDITRFYYEEQRQPSSESAWPACKKKVNRNGGREGSTQFILSKFRFRTCCRFFRGQNGLLPKLRGCSRRTF